MPTQEIRRERAARAYELHTKLGLNWTLVAERMGYRSGSSAREAAVRYKQRLDSAAEASGASSGSSDQAETAQEQAS